MIPAVQVFFGRQQLKQSLPWMAAFWASVAGEALLPLGLACLIQYRMSKHVCLQVWLLHSTPIVNLEPPWSPQLNCGSPLQHVLTGPLCSSTLLRPSDPGDLCCCCSALLSNP